MNKRDAEVLLDTYDGEPVAALTVALRRLLDRPDAPWPELLAAAPLSDTRRAALLVADPGALDVLATELNELRGFDRPAEIASVRQSPRAAPDGFRRS